MKGHNLLYLRKQLARISLSKQDVSTLCALPSPTSAKLLGTPKVVVAALDNLFDLWREILVDGAKIPLETYTYTCPHGNKITLNGPDLRGRILFSITSYFARLYLRYLTLGEPKSGGFIPKEHRKAFPKAFRIAKFSRFIPDDFGIPDSRRTQLRMHAAMFLSGMVSFRLVRLFRLMEAPDLAGHFESIGHQDLRTRFVQASFERERQENDLGDPGRYSIIPRS